MLRNKWRKQPNYKLHRRTFGGNSRIINCIDAPSSTDNDDDTETLTPGAIAGIAIGSLAGAVLLGYGVYRLCRRKPASSATVKVGSLLF
jgi:hypothetical protein